LIENDVLVCLAHDADPLTDTLEIRVGTDCDGPRSPASLKHS
jgi:hypothetical protein